MGIIQFRIPDRTQSTPNELAHPTVYVKSAWTDAWERAEYVYPTRVVECLRPQMPSARFVYDYGENLREGDVIFLEDEPLDLVDKYIQIRAVFPHVNSEEQIVWTGIVVSEARTVDGEYSGRQVFRARGLAHLLDRVRISTAKCWQDPDILTIDDCPVFNQRYSRGPGVLGNRSSAKHSGSYMFSSEGEVWSARDVCDYLLKQLAPSSITWYLAGALDMLDNIKQTWRLDGMTLLQALDTLIDRRRGLAWRLRLCGVNDASLEVRVFSRFTESVAEGDLVIEVPAFPATLQLNDRTTPANTIDMQTPIIWRDASAEYEKIVVRGARIKSCFTISYATSSLDAGWTAALESAYKTAGTTTDAAQADRYRQQDRFARVYSFFRIPANWSWSVAGEYAAPAAVKNGTVDSTQNGDQWGAFIRLLDHLPLKVGLDYSVSSPTDENPSNSEPEYLRPFAVLKDPTTSKYLLAEKCSTVTKAGSCSVRMASREGGIIVAARPHRHLLAKNHWSGAKISSIEPVFDWEDMYITVCAELDARIYREYELSEDPLDVPRTLTIDVPDAELWYVVPGTVVGVKSDGTLATFGGSSNIVRDDTARLKAVMLAARAWYGRPHRAIEYTRRIITMEFEPGTMIDAVANGLDTEEIGTLVESREWDWTAGDGAGTTTVKTGLGALDFRQFASRAVIGSLGRTVRALNREVAALKREATQIELRPAESAGGAGGGQWFSFYAVLSPTGHSAGPWTELLAPSYSEADGYPQMPTGRVTAVRAAIGGDMTAGGATIHVGTGPEWDVNNDGQLYSGNMTWYATTLGLAPGAQSNRRSDLQFEVNDGSVLIMKCVADSDFAISPSYVFAEAYFEPAG